jgi:hypothetical protein
MSCIILRGRWFYIIVPKFHAPIEDKTDDVKDGFYEELERMFNKFPIYHMKILLEDLNTKVSSEDIFKLTLGNETLHEISSDNEVKIVNVETHENLNGRSTMFPHRNIHKYTWMSPDGSTHNQIYYILIERRSHSNIIDVQSFRAADCGNEQYLVVAKIRERLAVNKQGLHRFHMERFNLN